MWWHLKTIFDKGLLYEDLKVLPYCPRCETPLSSHELGQPDVYTDEADLSPYVRFELVDGDVAAPRGASSLLIWTTTPWTLLSNVGVAVNPALTYAVVDGSLVARELVEQVFGEGAVVTATVPGTELVGLRYRRPFEDVEVRDGQAGLVVAADYVTVEEGTGLVHLAPAFGEVDRQVGRDHGLATLNPVGHDGRFTAAVPWLQGQSVRDANEQIVAELEAGGALHRAAWYVALGAALLAVPRGPALLGQAQLVRGDDAPQGRHAARERGHRLAPRAHPRRQVRRVAGEQRRLGAVEGPLLGHAAADLALRAGPRHLRRLARRAVRARGTDVSNVDPHRPAIDAVTFACPTCATTATRVTPVIDAWFDSGSMPAAQWGYPHVDGSSAAFAFPAEFIAEAIDQTRGWFYSLLAINTLVFGASAYRHVLCLGHIVDEDGRKMSKSLGNVIDPWDVLDTRGADALRWWMFSQGSPWTPTRGSLGAIDASMRDTCSRCGTRTRSS